MMKVMRVRTAQALRKLKVKLFDSGKSETRELISYVVSLKDESRRSSSSSGSSTASSEQDAGKDRVDEDDDDEEEDSWDNWT